MTEQLDQSGRTVLKRVRDQLAYDAVRALRNEDAPKSRQLAHASLWLDTLNDKSDFDFVYEAVLARFPLNDESA
jgi:hypothetical protein